MVTNLYDGMRLRKGEATMVDIETFKTAIAAQLKPLNPYAVILFGSYARGVPTPESDIDLYVVTRDEFIPETWSQKREVIRQISRQIENFRKDFSIDLLVHTKAMSEEFFKSGSSFSRAIETQGVRLSE